MFESQWLQCNDPAGIMRHLADTDHKDDAACDGTNINTHKDVKPCNACQTILTPDVIAIGKSIREKCSRCGGEGWCAGFDANPVSAINTRTCKNCNGKGLVVDYAAMPILADALEDAGCDNEEVLRHCRRFERCVYCLGEGKTICDLPSVFQTTRMEECRDCNGNGWLKTDKTHTPGCWVLRLILGDNQ